MIMFIFCLLPRIGEGAFNERVVEYSGSHETIVIKLSSKLSESQNVQTVIKFPEKSLQALVSGWSHDDISVVAREDKLFVKLLRPKSGFLDVQGESGSLYRLYVSDCDTECDSYVVIENARKLKQRKVMAIEVMKAMRLGKVLEGAQIVRYSGDPLFEAKGLKITPLYSYKYGYYTGYIFRVANFSSMAYELDVTRFRSDKLLLIGSTSTVIGSNQKGYLFCLFYR